MGRPNGPIAGLLLDRREPGAASPLPRPRRFSLRVEPGSRYPRRFASEDDWALRSIWLLLPLFAAWLLSAPARGDIGFPAAAAAARVAVPGQKLLAMRLRTRNGVWVYECDLVDTPPTAFTTATIDRDTGATLDIASIPVPPDEFQPTQQAVQRLNYATVDFAGAWQTANAFTGRIDTERVELLYEGGILAFRVSYFGINGFTEIDSITGGVIPGLVPGLGIEPTVTVAEMAGALAHSAWLAGPEWIPIEATALQRFDGVTVRVLLANRVSGNLMRPEIVQGFLIPSAVFAPLGVQEARADAVGSGSLVACRALDALAAVQAASPALGVNSVSLEPRQGGGHDWVVRIVDATETERDAHANASVPAAQKSIAFTAPVDIRPGDFTRDGVVDARDLAEILAFWGAFNPILDANNSGTVDAGDLATALSDWTP